MRINYFAPVNESAYVEINPKPRYEHDCDNCIYVGAISYYSNEHNYADVYLCQHDSSYSLIVRFSDEPSDYASNDIGYMALHKRHEDDFVGYAYEQLISTGILKQHYTINLTLPEPTELSDEPF